MTVQRFDYGRFRKATVTSHGFLKADAYVTRAGIFTYRMPDGTMRKELRHPDEVFKADSLKSLSEIPVTNDHPPEFVTSKNAKEYAKGFTGVDVERDAQFAKVGMTLMNADAIDAVKNGKLETSCGYTCELDETPGEWQGEKYDAQQKNIVYNHVAIVDRGRAGPEVRLRIDGAQQELEADSKTQTQTEDKKMKVKFKVDGLEFETEDTALAQAINKQGNDLAAAKSENEKLQGKCDAITGENKKKDAEIEDLKKQKLDHKQITAIGKARVALEGFASEVLGDEVKLDAMSDIEIKREVIKKNSPDMKLEGKSDAHVEGYFEGIMDNHKTDEQNQDDKKVVDAFKQHVDSDGKVLDMDVIREKMKKEDSQAYKTQFTKLADIK